MVAARLALLMLLAGASLPAMAQRVQQSPLPGWAGPYILQLCQPGLTYDEKTHAILGDAYYEHDLGDGATLTLVACRSHAYNGYSLAFLRENKESEAEPLALPTLNWDGNWVAEIAHPGISFAPDTRLLATYEKGRGLGDCGTAAYYEIDSDLTVTLKTLWQKTDCDELPFEQSDRYRVYHRR